MLDLFFYFIIFVFGLIVGSFLNCVVYRLEIGGSFLKGRSFCPHCKHELSWQDLIPVFSLLFLKGKCRYCQQKISLQYPLVELATGVLFVLIFYFWLSGFGWSVSVGIWELMYLFIVSGLIAAFAGLLLAARLGSMRGDTATGTELEVITIVLLGGVSIFGGRGSLFGVLLAILIVLNLRNGMGLLNITGEIQTGVIGMLLILSVLAPNIVQSIRNAWTRRRIKKEKVI